MKEEKTRAPFSRKQGLVIGGVFLVGIAAIVLVALLWKESAPPSLCAGDYQIFKKCAPFNVLVGVLSADPIGETEANKTALVEFLNSKDVTYDSVKNEVDSISDSQMLDLAKFLVDSPLFELSKDNVVISINQPLSEFTGKRITIGKLIPLQITDKITAEFTKQFEIERILVGLEVSGGCLKKCNNVSPSGVTPPPSGTETPQ